MQKDIGIYKITNLINGKFYIGSSVRLKTRLCKHLGMLNRNEHPNGRLQNSYNKYDSNFSFEIIENILEKDLLYVLEREQYYIDYLKPTLNLLQIAGSNLGYRFTAEARAEMSRTRKGRISSPEARKKQSQALKGIRTAPERSHAVLKLDLEKNIVDEFVSVRAAIKSLGIKGGTCILAEKIKFKQIYHGYYWLYKDDFRNHKLILKQ